MWAAARALSMPDHGLYNSPNLRNLPFTTALGSHDKSGRH
jgi:hypothetical protein